jgi:hypothetical protein
MPTPPSKPVEPDSYRVQPKIGFLSNPEQVKAYRSARDQQWFHDALTFAYAQMGMNIARFTRGKELLMDGAELFMDAFYNLDRPDAPPRERYSPLQEEKDEE